MMTARLSPSIAPTAKSCRNQAPAKSVLSETTATDRQNLAQGQSCRLRLKRSVAGIPGSVPWFRQIGVRGGIGFVQVLPRRHDISMTTESIPASTLSTSTVNLVFCFGCGDLEHADHTAQSCPDCGHICLECNAKNYCFCPISVEDQAAWGAAVAA